MTQCPSRAPEWPRALLPELYIYKVCSARGKGPKTPSRTTDAERDGAFSINAFLFVVPNIVAPPGLLGLDDLLYLDAITTNMMKTSKRGNVTIR